MSTLIIKVVVNIYNISATKNGKPFDNPVLSNEEYLSYIHKKRKEINFSTKNNNQTNMVEKIKTA